MLRDAARAGDWDTVVKLEGACGLLISQLNQAARGESLQPIDAQARTRIMQRILLRAMPRSAIWPSRGSDATSTACSPARPAPCTDIEHGGPAMFLEDPTRAR